MNAYDFDDTIYDGQSAFDFFKGFARRNPKLLKFIPSLMNVLYQYKREKIQIDEFHKKYSEKIEEFFTKEHIDLSIHVAEFWDKREGRIKSFYKEIQQEDDLIITAAPEFLMKEICQRLGIKNLIASDFNPSTGEIVNACFREEKYNLFTQQYPDVRIDKFYTDSLNDKFLFPCADKVFLVKGDFIKRIK